MDERAFSGRVALVTGGSGGIGAAICRELAAAGASIAIGYGRNTGAAERCRCPTRRSTRRRLTARSP